MSNDNNVLLKNEVKRSSFNQTHTVKRTMRFGSVSPVETQFTLAGDTIETWHDSHIELKPLRDKLNTQIDYHLRSYWVAISDIWKGAKQTFAINKEVYNNTRKPLQEYLRLTNDSPVVPFVRRSEVFRYLLATFGIGNVEHILSDSLTTGNTGLHQTDWKFNYVDSAGIRHDNQSVNNGVSSAYSFLMPRICKNGCDNGFNFYISQETISGNTVIVTNIFITRPEAINCLCQHFPQLVGSISYIVLRVAQLNPNQNTWWLDLANDTDHVPHRKPSRALTTSNHVCYVANTSRGVPSINLGSMSAQGVTEYSGTGITIQDLFNTILVSLFFDPDLLGKGSLAESLGAPFFFYKRVSSPYFLGGSAFVNHGALFPYAYNFNNTFAGQTSHVWNPCYLQVDGGDNLINYLPFLAYQKIYADNFLLPHEVLPAETFEIDSPYFGSLSTAISVNCQTQSECDVLRVSISQEDYLRSTGQVATSFNHMYLLQTNQLLNALFSVAPLIATDYYTRGWITPNHGANQSVAPDSILTQTTSINDTLHYYASMVAKKMGFLKRIVGQGLTYEEWVNSIFAVDGVESENNKAVYIGGDVRTINTQTVINTELADDTAPLGKKGTVAEDQLNGMSHVAFFAKEYGFYMAVEFLSVPNEYTQTIADCMTTALAGRNKNELDLQLNPIFGDTGDEPKKLVGYRCDIDENNPTSNPILMYDNKNYWLKDAPNILRGDYTDLYQAQTIRPTEFDGLETLELTYSWLQRPKSAYTNVFVDVQNDNVLADSKVTFYRKSSMPKLNNIGLIG